MRTATCSERQQALNRDLRADKLGRNEPVAKHQHAPTDGRHFLEVGRDHDQRAASVSSLTQHFIYLALGADVNTGRRLFEYDERLVEMDPARQHHLLLVAARELLY